MNAKQCYICDKKKYLQKTFSFPVYNYPYYIRILRPSSGNLEVFF